MPWVEDAECMGCGVCVDSCEQGCLEMGDEDVVVIDMTNCNECDACVDSCPVEAIHSGAKPE